MRLEKRSRERRASVKSERKEKKQMVGTTKQACEGAREVWISFPREQGKGVCRGGQDRMKCTSGNM